MKPKNKAGGITDKQRIDWLEEQAGIGLINDDFGHWIVSGDGSQPVPKNKNERISVSTFIFLDKKAWKKTIRQAIDFAIKQEKNN